MLLISVSKLPGRKPLVGRYILGENTLRTLTFDCIFITFDYPSTLSFVSKRESLSMGTNEGRFTLY